MSVGSMTLVCLLVAAQATAPGTDVTHMNQPVFAIPIRVQAESRAEIRELLLYASRDQGRTWDNVARATPDKEQFKVNSQGDGLYWFTVAVVNQQGQQDPPTPTVANGCQKILVDTKKPLAQLTAERLGDEVLVRYSVQDDYLEPTSLKVEYRALDNPSPIWTPAIAQPTAPGQGNARFRGLGNSGLVVRVVARDTAGNENGPTQQELPPVGSTTLVANLPVPLPNPVPVPVPLANPVPVPIPGPAFVGVTPQQPEPYFPQPQPQPQPYQAMQPQARPVEPNPGQPLAHTGGLTQVSTAGQGPQRNVGPFKEEIEITNKKQVKVDFEVTKFGPSGLERVDVYLTTDEGQTWTPTPNDHKPNLPTPGDARSNNGSLQGSVMVTLPQENVTYGITLVVTSRASLSKGPPKPGDPPQMRVELDQTPPVAQLWPLEPDPQNRDSLMLIWTVKERNLATNPITIEWAEKPSGPWHSVGPTALPNTNGKWSWKVTPEVPPKVFLKLSVRDAAGNVGIAQTSEAVTIDLSVPEVNIIRRPTSMGNQQR